MHKQILLEKLEDVQAFAQGVAKLLTPGLVIFLQGDLGVGKTTFVRAVLHALGYTEKVKSPTYTLVETYVIGALTIYHFDLYRLNDAEELWYLGIEEYFAQDAITFVEWPEQGRGVLPAPDLLFCYQGRQLTIEAKSTPGKALLEKLYVA